MKLSGTQKFLMSTTFFTIGFYAGQENWTKITDTIIFWQKQIGYISIGIFLGSFFKNHPLLMIPRFDN